jgi:Domain of unknown function (DUF6378)
MDTKSTEPMPLIETVAEEAQRVVCGDRRKFYNHPYDNFKQTAELWNALGFSFQGRAVEPEDVTAAMMLIKMSRESYKHKRDNLVDIVGYSLCHELILKRKEDLSKTNVDSNSKD